MAADISPLFTMMAATVVKVMAIARKKNENIKHFMGPILYVEEWISLPQTLNNHLRYSLLHLLKQHI